MPQDCATPMRVIAAGPCRALCEAEGRRRAVSLYLLSHQPVSPGMWVAVERDFALAVLDGPSRDAAA